MPAEIGPYELLNEIGRGGMGVVYTARQKGLDRLVALKVIAGGRLAGGEAEMRFAREAQMAARLRHPNIVAVHESGRADGCAYFSMDFLEGGDLAERMRRKPYTSREAAELMLKVAEGIAYAHREDIIHRDLKPSNILLDREEPRIADFGLAAPLEAGGDLTAYTSVLGTPHYLAPEAFAQGSAAMSASSDIYALGAILYEMLTGRAPFAGASPAELPSFVLSREPVGPRVLNPTVDRDLETICLACLEKNPARRYATAEALAEDLWLYLEGKPIVARPVSPLGRFVRWARRRPALAASWLLLAALAAVSTAGALVVGRERDAALTARTAAESGRLRAVAAERKAEDQLWRAELSRAQALTHSHRPGQRFEAMNALKNAGRILVTAELRDAGVAALAQADVKEHLRWPARPFPDAHFVLAPDFASYLAETRPGIVEWRELRSERVRATFNFGAGKPELRSQPLFSPDGALLLLRRGNHSICVWSLAQGRALAEIPERPAYDEGHARLASDYAWHPSATEFVVRGAAGGLSFHSALDGHELRRWENAAHATSVRYSPQGNRVAVADGEAKRVFVIDASKLALQQTIDFPSAPCGLAWRPDGSEIAVGCSDGKIRIIGADNGTIVRELAGHRARIFACQYSPDGYLLATNSGDASTRLWDGRTGESQLIIPGVGGGLELLFSQDGRMLGTSRNDTEGYIMDLAVPEFVREMPALRGDDVGGMVGALDFTPDGSQLAVATWRGTDIIETATGRVLSSVLAAGGERDESSVALSSDGAVLYVCTIAHGLVRRDLKTGAQTTLDPEAGFLIGGRSTEGARLVLTNPSRGEAKILATDGTLLHRRSGLNEVWSASLSPDGRWLAAQFTGRGESAKANARVWTVAEGKLAHESDLGPLGLVQFSRDGRWLYASGARGAELLRVSDWRPAPALPEPVAKAGAVPSFTADGKLLAVTVDEKIYLMDPATGAKLIILSSPSGNASTARVCLSPDGTRLAVMWDDASVDLWDLTTLRRGLAGAGLDW